MAKDLKHIEGAGLPTVGGPKRMLDTYDQALTKAQQRELAPRIAEEQLKLEVAERQAGLRHHASGADFERHKDLVRELEQGKSDFTVRLTSETASGRMEVSTTRANNTLYIVLAVAIAVVFFIFFSR